MTIEGTFEYDDLFAGEQNLVTYQGTVLTGQGVLSRGSVLAQDSGNGDKLVLVDSGSATTSITEPYAILAEEVDTSSGDVVAPLYAAGVFNEDALIFGGTDDKETHRAALRDLNMFIKPITAA